MLTENKTLYVYQSDIDVYNAMAIDEYLLQCVSSGEYSTAVHIYSWGRPGITLGRFTPSDVIKTPCSIDVTRRITGGNALYHKDDIAYGIVMKLSDNKNVGLELCKKVSEIIQNVFCDFNVDTQIISRERNLNNRRLACNETFSRCELVYSDEKKAAAAAQKNNRTAILQQGSVYLNHKPENINEYLTDGCGIVNTQNNLNLDKNDFMQKLGAEFLSGFGVRQINCSLCEKQEVIKKLINKKYGAEEWVWQNFK